MKRVFQAMQTPALGAPIVVDAEVPNFDVAMTIGGSQKVYLTTVEADILADMLCAAAQIQRARAKIVPGTK